MLRLILVVAVVVGMARLGFAYFEDSALDDATNFEIKKTRQKLDIGWRNLEVFRTVLNQTLVELADEEITFSQAIDRVMEVSRSHYPTYLRMLAPMKLEPAVREYVGKDLIMHFVVELEDHHTNQDHLKKVLDRLKVEQANMFPRSE